MDKQLFGRFLYDMLLNLRSQDATKHRSIVLYMDNARIHKSSEIIDVCRHFNATIIFAAQYSPFLQPIESLFGAIKSTLRRNSVDQKR